MYSVLYADRIARGRANRFIRYSRRTTLKGGCVARANPDVSLRPSDSTIHRFPGVAVSGRIEN